MVFSLARDLAHLREQSDDAGAVRHGATPDLTDHELGEPVAVEHHFPPLQLRPPADPQLVGSRGRRAGPRLGVGPAMLEVAHPHERSVVPLPARAGDVEGFAGVQVDPGRENMDMRPAVRLPVPHRGPAVSAAVHAGEGQGLEIVEHRPDLRIRRPVIRSPGDYPADVAVPECETVGDIRDLLRITAQYIDPGPRDARGIGRRQQIRTGFPRRSGAVRQERDQHQRPRISFSRSAITDSSASTATRPPARAAVFTRRAIWFRLLPIPAS